MRLAVHLSERREGLREETWQTGSGPLPLARNVLGTLKRSHLPPICWLPREEGTPVHEISSCDSPKPDNEGGEDREEEAATDDSVVEQQEEQRLRR